ncbi:putative selenium-dependent hydroxylase accessory protein YqeC [Clostridium sp. P21]|uniref:Putative selenium-dependent hydroxylase accessory protein YqeC n=1 Tax=Clostridium muellerianum TaxID=2716538 RepID=A0A7Y0EHX1_9CLOT|nr:selenium cofactor biosynthesis protein YqeC [Clostridium muellerianum]NMM63789.1 putative selenium-dependent hydroxylase accessory protein YqeC [Clostridium muellerianum]
MNVKDLLNLKTGDVISIVGAGGKTTFMYSLAEELRYENKVLVTTTTKIYMPHKKYYDFAIIDKNNLNKYNYKKDNGIYLYGSSLNEEQKIVGLSTELIETQLPYFNYVLIEADGSKRKPIKGWKDNEPVISKKTCKTIGILSIEVLGKKINSENVHRLDEFKRITSFKDNELINIECLTSLVFHHKGLFKDAEGEKVLFINKVDSEAEFIIAKKLVNNILENNNNYIDRILIGSLKNKQYQLII